MVVDAFLKPILVVGGTGRQGGAVLSSLLTLSPSTPLRALTRNTNSPAALKLKENGVEVVQGDLGDVGSLKRALNGVGAVFLVTTPPANSSSLPERTQAANLLSALPSPPPFLVFSSVSGTSTSSPVPKFAAKAFIEEDLAAAKKEKGLEFAVVAPSMFYDLFPRQAGRKAALLLGLMEAVVGEKKEVKMVASEDIGHFAATFLLAPSTSSGRRLPLASSSHTMFSLACLYSAASPSGKPQGKTWIPQWVVRWLMPKMLVDMMRHESEGDVEVLRRDWSGLKSFEEYLQKGKEE
ncbi:hypothetical protein JCM8547_005681 [Rhodosporidiobolus lusitaniae]